MREKSAERQQSMAKVMQGYENDRWFDIISSITAIWSSGKGKVQDQALPTLIAEPGKCLRCKGLQSRSSISASRKSAKWQQALLINYRMGD